LLAVTTAAARRDVATSTRRRRRRRLEGGPATLACARVVVVVVRIPLRGQQQRPLRGWHVRGTIRKGTGGEGRGICTVVWGSWRRRRGRRVR